MGKHRGKVLPDMWEAKMNTGDMVTVDYRGETVTREIIHIYKQDQFNIYYLDGIEGQVFIEKDFK
jgi:hypothetical protein